MKNYLALLFILAVFMYSCKKDHATLAVAPVGSIVGTWQIAVDSIKDYDKTGLTAQYANNYGPGVTFQFAQSGSGISHNDTIPGNLTFTYTVADGKVILNYPAQNYNNMSPGATVDTARIGVLTNNNLELVYKGIFFGINGSTAYYESDVYFSKQLPLTE